MIEANSPALSGPPASVPDAPAVPESPAVRSSPRTAATPIVPGRWIHQPPTWFQPLELPVMFARSAPLEVELGSGDGSFLISWAGRHPERNFIGVERLLGRMRKLDKKAQRLNLENIRGLRIEASYCLEYLVPPGKATAVHVYFPDPWPKRRHHKNRLINERFVEITAGALAPDGVIHLRTDDADYFEQMQRVFGASPRFVETETPTELQEVLTDFERGFLARGIATRRASYRVLPAPLPPTSAQPPGQEVAADE